MGPDPIAGAIAFAKVEAMGERAELSHLSVLSQTLNAYDAINIQFTSGTTGTPRRFAPATSLIRRFPGISSSSTPSH
jgi:acyl-coenzyme A synthetase/AMP-(fatty) acid ligase